MKKGNLIKIKDCKKDCRCLFCKLVKTRYGLILEVWRDEGDHDAVIAQFENEELVFRHLEIMGTTSNRLCTSMIEVL